MPWWTLAYINKKDKTLVLWQDRGQEHPVTREDWNPSLEVPWPVNPEDRRRMQEALDRSSLVECFVPKESTSVLHWRVVPNNYSNHSSSSSNSPL
jgi:hypothetical protein